MNFRHDAKLSTRINLSLSSDFGTYRNMRRAISSSTHVQLSILPRSLHFGLSLHQGPSIVCASNESSGETVRMRELI